MEVRLQAVGGARGVSVVTVTVVVIVSVPVLLAHHRRLVRALFIAHMGDARMRIHSQDGWRGNCTP
jgi:hypothetical protein